MIWTTFQVTVLIEYNIFLQVTVCILILIYMIKTKKSVLMGRNDLLNWNGQFKRLITALYAQLLVIWKTFPVTVLLESNIISAGGWKQSYCNQHDETENVSCNAKKRLIVDEMSNKLTYNSIVCTGASDLNNLSSIYSSWIQYHFCRWMSVFLLQSTW